MSIKKVWSNKHVVVLDTSAFLAGYDPFISCGEQVTVPKVEDELLRNNMIKTRFQTAVESGRIRIVSPTLEATTVVRSYAAKVGDSHKLSETDLQVLSLAFELKNQGRSPQIITDDYSIQNVARESGIEFLALATFGIKRLLEWIRYCPACHKQYPEKTKYKECQVCGTVLKRKPRKPSSRIGKA